ncbi:melanocyte-stimulating hormone receptor-like [Orbicella faveolata]|uniref:melanocyte-stimulating hormone receptor-like n=1 Tax=Orbicella faveolata TaxID=48498 RepID=UPI0009E5DA2F|nr:melanocyte-stimulating hormone receptor-like [Orbicella faveolata]
MGGKENFDDLGNEDRDSQPETITIVNSVLNAPFILISIISNTLILAAILRTPSLRSPSTILLCSLAVSDIFVGLVVQPLNIAYRLTEKGSLELPGKTVTFLALGVSLSTMTAISLDRFLALHFHMRYPNIMTTQRALYISAALWFFIFLSSWLSFWNKNAYSLLIACNIAICLFLSTFCYIRIYRIVRHHQLQIHNQQQALEINSEDNQNMLRSTKSAKSTFIYYVLMLLCYTPLFIGFSVSLVSPDHFSKAWTFVETVAFMNSSINPFLYCWRLRELRTAVVKTARQMFCTQMEES